ncbi:MAG: ribosomal protein S18-alanine N-acetyltransferase [Hyphomonadaceae bacterium]|nr:ribosomal protein S18-alanine N-acetyltransferase [Hyphomonadaceae bacterium]
MMARIGDAREAGAEALAALHARAFADSPTSRSWSAAEIVEVTAPPHAIAVAAFAPELAGFVLAWTIGEEAEILTLATAPERRRAGVARALLRAAAALAAARGAMRIVLEVGEDNAAARGLYESVGFAEIGRRKGYYRGGEGAQDALVLRLVLHSEGRHGE